LTRFSTVAVVPLFALSKAIHIYVTLSLRLSLWAACLKSPLPPPAATEWLFEFG
jgi:hypothetical protein